MQLCSGPDLALKRVSNLAHFKKMSPGSDLKNKNLFPKLEHYKIDKNFFQYHVSIKVQLSSTP